MSNMLSRIGIGAATVDTKLPSTVTAGESVEATVEVVGGNSEQEIDGVYFALETRYDTDEGHGIAVIDRHQLSEGFTIAPDEERSFDVTLQIPRETPITMGRTEVWVETGLDVDWALDPDDTDYLTVEPTERMQAVLDALSSLGFDLRTARPEATPGGVFSTGAPFVQEFEFVPRDGSYRGDFDELEVIFEPTENALDIRLEVDQRGGMLSELSGMDLDERFEQLSVTTTDAGEVEDQIRTILDQHV
jgi:sporulation-control protein